MNELKLDEQVVVRGWASSDADLQVSTRVGYQFGDFRGEDPEGVVEITLSFVRDGVDSLKE